MIPDYISSFPIPIGAMPDRLRQLLQPAGFNPTERIDVAVVEETNQHGPCGEHLLLMLATAPKENADSAQSPPDICNGVVTLNGFSNIVSSWSDGNRYAFNLSDDVWTTLKLSARCVGNEEQRVLYDDLTLPEFSVVEGEISTEYEWKLSRNIMWKMSNEYLRRYLVHRDVCAMRLFYYQAFVQKCPEILALMHRGEHGFVKHETDWYRLDVREHEGFFQLEVWASVIVAQPVLCPDQNADGLVWPGCDKPVTRSLADRMVHGESVFLDDKFLNRYEENQRYDCTPIQGMNGWDCSPSYKNQWSFTSCYRVGRNLIKVPLRELYKPKPDREILRAHAFAIDPKTIDEQLLQLEHIVCKVDRLVHAMLLLGEMLHSLGGIADLKRAPTDYMRFDRTQIETEYWRHYPQLVRMCASVPLDISEMTFLKRCKELHETIVWALPGGPLRALLGRAGCRGENLQKLGSIKLLQAVVNIAEALNTDLETPSAFLSDKERDGWDRKNPVMSPWFVLNDLRTADAHMKPDSIRRLQELGLDLASLNVGYGQAYDFMLDKVTMMFSTSGSALSTLLNRVY